MPSVSCTRLVGVRFVGEGAIGSFNTQP
jgi:hypothetical protein